ncbi:class II D-tagatose-bisphosphate aldolase non-catalytic subunit [Allobaculum sp. JKK-2023]|uniref:class II D-tagatose-bisphosphate aldolase non-catalytic subunit n=1 Tax=Allobaculum sp. JKK-2023 TaxID=3108943 RepID=UPI002B05CBF3|nr:class II D-tagatose-bisphosphate aldolase, non-catalytic subunit [Allobaculum sp. JKK-2023]
MRSRYYIGQSKVQAELDKLVMNLNYYGINLALLSQFMPIQYTKVREGKLANKPEALIQDRIRNTIDEYTFATQQGLL